MVVPDVYFRELPIAWFIVINAKSTIASAPVTSRSDNVIDNNTTTVCVGDVRTTHYYPVINYRDRKLKI